MHRSAVLQQRRREQAPPRRIVRLPSIQGSCLFNGSRLSSQIYSLSLTAAFRAYRTAAFNFFCCRALVEVRVWKRLLSTRFAFGRCVTAREICYNKVAHSPGSGSSLFQTYLSPSTLLSTIKLRNPCSFRARSCRHICYFCRVVLQILPHYWIVVLCCFVLK